MASSPSPPRRLRPDDVAERLKAQFGDDVEEATERFGHVQVTVSPARYRDVVLLVRDDPDIACDFFDYTTGVDRKEDGLHVVTQVTSSRTRLSVRVRTRCEGDPPACPSISDLYGGASWHEREAWELFGIEFRGHPHLVKLLLPEQFEGHPLRKDFELMSRVAKPWPGDQELPD